MNFLQDQIITYLGNKRKLLPLIDKAVRPKDKACLDLFSGSGVVSRLFKERGASKIIANDLEDYARVISQCYLTNFSDFNPKKYDYFRRVIDQYSPSNFGGYFSGNYAPKNDGHILAGERCFYTQHNAKEIDRLQSAIFSSVPAPLRCFFLAPLCYEASVHVNTSGVFKGFYKNAQGVGQWGGTGRNALSRICAPIELPKPIFSSHECEIEVLQQDVIQITSPIRCDVAYLDPPYNQHPYGSNYFMLNLIVNNDRPTDVSHVSGIPKNWNRSAFNKKTEALQSIKKAIDGVKASERIVISYNSDGFISQPEMLELLSTYSDDVSVLSEEYLTFRACRNLSSRDLHTTEYLFIIGA